MASRRPCLTGADPIHDQVVGDASDCAHAIPVGGRLLAIPRATGEARAAFILGADAFVIYAVEPAHLRILFIGVGQAWRGGGRQARPGRLLNARHVLVEPLTERLLGPQECCAGPLEPPTSSTDATVAVTAWAL